MEADAMATKRIPLDRRRVGGEAEYQAFRDVFEIGSTFFGDLEPFGIFEPHPIDGTEAERERYREDIAARWQVHGARFLAEREPGGEAWALKQFGAPRGH
jgi:hypothetical protein